MEIMKTKYQGIQMEAPWKLPSRCSTKKKKDTSKLRPGSARPTDWTYGLRVCMSKPGISSTNRTVTLQESRPSA